MRMQSLHYLGGAIFKPTHVFFAGTGALKKGTGVCWDFGYIETDSPLPIGVTAARVDGLATDAWEIRCNVVNVPIGGSPSTTARGANNQRFAGVVARDYAASATGQVIEIYEPGSVCEIALGYADDVTIDSTVLTCSASQGDPGRFGPGQFQGRGSAVVMQTSTGNVLSSDLTGQSALDAAGTTLTAVAGTTFVTDGVQAGDKVYILGVENDGTNSGTPACYTVSSVTSETVLVLTSAASDGGTMQCSFYVQRANPTVLAYLQDGPESNLIEYLQPAGVGHASNATFLMMQGGTTYLLSGVTPGTGDHRCDIADGTFVGEEKVINALGATTTYKQEINFGTALQDDGDTALDYIDFDAAGEIAHLKWTAGGWRNLYALGATEN